AAIDAATGKTNQDPFDGAKGWPLYGAGTLLMQPPRKVRYRHTSGRIYWRITYSFLMRPETHNKMSAADGQFYAIGYGGDASKPLYPGADFKALFKPPA